MSLPVNILIMTGGFKPGPGKEAEYAHQLALGLRDRGDRVTVLATHGAGEDAFDATCGYEVLRAECSLTAESMDLQVISCLPEWIRMLDYVLRARRIDCLLCMGAAPLGMYGSLAARRFCVPFGVVACGRERTGLAFLNLRPIQKDYALRRADFVVCLTRMDRDRFEEQGIPPDRLQVVPGGVDPARFAPGEGDPRRRTGLGVNGNSLLLATGIPGHSGWPGRMLGVMALTAAQDPDVVWLVEGSEALRAAMTQGARAHPVLRGRIRFVAEGPPADRGGLYRVCETVAIPYDDSRPDRDGWSTGDALLEAGACGRAVVAGRSGDAIEFVVDGHTGLLVDPWDPEEMAYGLFMLLTDRDYAARLGANGLRMVREEWSWERVTGQVRGAILGAMAE